VTEAVHDEPLKQGHVYIAPGGLRHLMIRGAKLPACRLIEANPVSGHRPSVDVLFRSVVQTVGDTAVGVILTGMGRDGAAGLLEMREGGCRTIGQNEASCVVYGIKTGKMHSRLNGGSTSFRGRPMSLKTLRSS
jgi:two-component system chemotaxis response regulator CheB